MKRIILVRHAKSDWGEHNVDDHDRPLNSRGKKDAPLMAKQVFSNTACPDLIITSSALRAVTTAKIFAKECNYPESKIDVRKELYSASWQSCVNIINAISDADCRSVMIFGHNPFITELADRLTRQSFGNLPTCGVVAIDSNVASWAEISTGLGKLAFFEYPKMGRV
jgi:phosphohistidine phosphatase